MSRPTRAEEKAEEEEQEQEQLTGSEDGEEDFDEDMEALRRACLITGANPDELRMGVNTAVSSSHSDDEDKDEDEDDFEFVRNIKNRFSTSTPLEPLHMKPLITLPPALSDGDDDDFETLRAIQKRFSSYDNDALMNGIDNSSETHNPVHASTSNFLFANETDSSQRTCQLDGNQMEPLLSIEWHGSDPCRPSTVPSDYSSFPMAAKVFMDAIKKNRTCQKLMRSKLIMLEAKIEENKKLRERVKILKDFQVSCKRRMGRTLSQKKDARVQLISATKSWFSKDSKVDNKKVRPMYFGPTENSHVANYRMALTNFPLSLEHKKWADKEKKNLEMGIRQQFQEMLLQVSVDRLSDSEGSHGDFSCLDNILMSIKDLDITPENIREFLPKVNWEQLASMYVIGRSGAECEARWLNFEDPLINHTPWTAQEDKSLLFLVQDRGISNWFDIAVSLGTNRTPFQCLARYQRSLNASILKREWTKDEDDKLCTIVEAFGESDWQSVASAMEGRTGTQCSNRWKKSLHPTRVRVGKWTSDEDKRLRVAQMLFGPKNWKKTAQFVPGRTEVQCRERWVNSLDPSLNWDAWTKEEDSKLRAAIADHGYCWTKVATFVPGRTDNMCRRRWKVLLPHEVPLLQAAKRIQKAAFISNFVDRESERPALGPNDFIPLPLITSNNNFDHCMEQASKSSKNSKNRRSKKLKKTAKSKKPKKNRQVYDEDEETAEEDYQSSETSNVTELAKDDPSSPLYTASLSTINDRVLRSDTRKKYLRPRTRRKKCTESDENVGHLELHHGSFDFRGNNDSTETRVGSDTTTLKERPSKAQIKRKKWTTKSGECQNSVELSGKLRLLEDVDDVRIQRDSVFCLDFSQSSMADEETDTHFENAGAEMTVKKSHSKKKSVDSSDNGNLSISSRSRNSMKRVSDDGGIQSTSLFKVHSSKKATVLKKSTKRSKALEPKKELQKVGVEKLKPVDLNCSLRNSGITEDDITLASFLQNRSKKRKLQVGCVCNQDYPRSEMQNELGFSSEGREWRVGNSNLSDMTGSGGLVSEKISSSQMQSSHFKHKTTSVSTGNEPVKDPGNIRVESNHGTDEADDICLASLRKRLKSKSHTTKSGSHSCLPSIVTRESQPQLIRVDKLYDENHKALVVSSEPGVLDRNNGQKYLESKAEELAIDVEGDCDGCDVTLASFLKYKSKRRRLQSTKAG